MCSKADKQEMFSIVTHLGIKPLLNLVMPITFPHVEEQGLQYLFKLMPSCWLIIGELKLFFFLTRN